MTSKIRRLIITHGRTVCLSSIELLKPQVRRNKTKTVTNDDYNDSTEILSLTLLISPLSGKISKQIRPGSGGSGGGGVGDDLM